MWQGVTFEIQPKEAIGQSLRKNLFPAEFQMELFHFKICKKDSILQDSNLELLEWTNFVIFMTKVPTELLLSIKIEIILSELFNRFKFSSTRNFWSS